MPTKDQLQQVVDAENKRLNEINVAKAQARLRDIEVINAEISRLQEKRASLQKEIAELPFDSVTIETMLGAGASE